MTRRDLELSIVLFRIISVRAGQAQIGLRIKYALASLAIQKWVLERTLKFTHFGEYFGGFVESKSMVFPLSEADRLIGELALAEKKLASSSLAARELIGDFFNLIACEMYQKEADQDVPKFAEFLVGAVAKKRYRNSLLQSLDEDFRNDRAAGMSVRRARLRYWAASLNSIGPQLWAASKRIGLFGLLADYARRLIH